MLSCRRIAGLAVASWLFCPGQTQSTVCGDIVRQAGENATYVFPARHIYECLTSVPFHPAVARRFLHYLHERLQFQSTLAYLLNPPPGYQQPAVDLLGGLESIQQAVESGVFANQYEFEAAVQALLFASHDGHLSFQGGILSAFGFGSPRDIVHVSLDGVQEPKVYLAEDVLYMRSTPSFVPSAIKTIDGQDTLEFLDAFALRNSYGALERHTDFNHLMFSAAQDIQGYFNTFSGDATFYPGDTITFVLENGTTITESWLGVYLDQGPTGPLETGGDFYNFFVMGLLPASYNASASDDFTGSGTTSSDASGSASTTASTSSPAPTGWDSPAYAAADVLQPGFGLAAGGGGGWLTGYFLNASSTAVLSIPSFDEYGDGLQTFQDTVSLFLDRSKKAGLRRVVIDLQQNTGGQALLAIDTFRRFFPDMEPFAGSRMRAHPLADVMGNAITDYFDDSGLESDDYAVLAVDEWVATDRLDAETGENFTSWAEFYGPHEHNGDNFTTTQRYNLSSDVFVASSTDNEVDFHVYNPPSPAQSPAYAAENIILLTDGTCSSACALFYELMHHQARVRTVVAGGLPTSGPMQGAAGTRGARGYDVATLDANMEYAHAILTLQGRNDTAAQLPKRTAKVGGGIYAISASLNLRDAVRSEDQATPLQFVYDAADCRIWYTASTVFNYTALWLHAADAVWQDEGLCVRNSTGWAARGSNGTAPPAAVPAPAFSIASHIPAATNGTGPTPPGDFLDDASLASFPRNAIVLRECKGEKDTSCGKGFLCKFVQPCSDQPSRYVCVTSCARNLGGCSTGKLRGTCRVEVESWTKDAKVQFGSQWVQPGYCQVKETTCNKKSEIRLNDEWVAELPEEWDG